MIVLGIETSCDETAASVIEGKGDSVKVLSNVVSSQIEIHKKYNGVVPEVAAREHVLNILPVVNEALVKAGINPPRLADARHPSHRGDYPPRLANTPRSRQGGTTSLFRGDFGALPAEGVDAIAVTVGPGLITSLLVGVETARTLAYVWKLPLVAVNHIEGHIMANFIMTPSKTLPASLSLGTPPKEGKPSPSALRAATPPKEGKPSPSALRAATPPKEGIKFPALILTVSGGHTMLVLMKGYDKFQTIGETRDDAAGEAFDKAAKLMKLGYPGGPIVSKFAAEYKKIIHPVSRGASHPSQEGIVSLPRPMLNDSNFDFSFSGLKTALLYKIQKDKNWQNRVPEYCHEFERAVVETLVGKAVKAARKYKVKTMMLAGGVSANLVLREEFQNAAAKFGIACHIPPMEYTTDNAAMVAAAGYFRAKKKNYTAWQKLKADSNKEFI